MSMETGSASVMEGAVEAPRAIEIDGVTKVYASGVRAVDEVTLGVPAGQVFGFLGPNGAGKTTTIKMLCGLVTPTTGRLRLNGWDVRRDRAQAVRQIGAVLEGARNVYWQLSAWQNLLYFGRLKAAPAGLVRPRAEYLLRELGLWDRRDEQVGGFSRGMQQKVALAAALVADPPVLLLDEPTIGLDVEAARTVKDWITTLARDRGKTVVLSTHQLHVAEELCERIAVIREGRIVADMPVGELLGMFRRRDLYEVTVGGEPRDLALPDGFTARTENGSTLISGTVGEPTVLYGLIERLRERGLLLESIEQPRPDLEHVFLELLKRGDADA